MNQNDIVIAKRLSQNAAPEGVRKIHIFLTNNDINEAIEYDKEDGYVLIFNKKIKNNQKALETAFRLVGIHFESTQQGIKIDENLDDDIDWDQLDRVFKEAKKGKKLNAGKDNVISGSTFQEQILNLGMEKEIAQHDQQPAENPSSPVVATPKAVVEPAVALRVKPRVPPKPVRSSVLFTHRPIPVLPPKPDMTNIKGAAPQKLVEPEVAISGEFTSFQQQVFADLENEIRDQGLAMKVLGSLSQRTDYRTNTSFNSLDIFFSADPNQLQSYQALILALDDLDVDNIELDPFNTAQGNVIPVVINFDQLTPETLNRLPAMYAERKAQQPANVPVEAKSPAVEVDIPTYEKKIADQYHVTIEHEPGKSTVNLLFRNKGERDKLESYLDRNTFEENMVTKGQNRFLAVRIEEDSLIQQMRRVMP